VLSKRIELKNFGRIEATARIELAGDANFSLTCENTAPLLRPNDTFEFMVNFNPKSTGQGQFTHELNVKTLMNPFENIPIDLTGIAFEDEVLFDDLPENSEDTLDLGDCWVNKEKVVSFTMVNNSKGWLRFTWPNDLAGNKHDCIAFLPSVG